MCLVAWQYRIYIWNSECNVRNELISCCAFMATIPPLFFVCLFLVCHCNDVKQFCYTSIRHYFNTHKSEKLQNKFPRMYSQWISILQCWVSSLIFFWYWSACVWMWMFRQTCTLCIRKWNTQTFRSRCFYVWPISIYWKLVVRFCVHLTTHRILSVSKYS